MQLEKFKVDRKMFRHASTLHGVGHTSRVMALAWKLGSLIDQPSQRDAAWCAAYIHDLSRTHDGVCHLHGPRAAEDQLPIYRKLFIEQGLSDEDLEAVYTAVFQHSLLAELDPVHPHYLVTALLKDADALDRIRLGPHDLDPEYLRLEESHKLIKPAKKLFMRSLLIKNLTPVGCIEILDGIKIK